jgi:HupE/UreJ protein
VRARLGGAWTGALAAALLLLRAAPSAAHAVGISRGEYRADGTEIHAELLFARTELALALPALDADGDGSLSPAEIDGGRARLEAWLADGIAVRSSGETCTPRLEDAAATELDGVELGLRYRCRRAVAGFSVRLKMLPSLSLGHRHLASAAVEARQAQAVLFEAQPEIALEAPPSDDATREPTESDAAPGDAGQSGSGVGRFSSRTERGRLAAVDGPSPFWRGAQSLIAGPGHLLFLVVLIFVGGGRRSWLRALATYSIAQAIALPLGVLGVFRLNPALAREMIALSILLFGIENCFVPDARPRWRLAFVFGLLHGVALGGALRGLAIDPAHLPGALAASTMGVETAQVAVVALLVVLADRLATCSWLEKLALRATSVAISSAVLLWLVVELSARYGGALAQSLH